MPDLIRKTLETKLKADPGERCVVAKISTADVDMVGDVVIASGIDFADYERNPVVLLQHNDQQLPVGKAVAIQYGSRHVEAKVQFAERPDSLPKEAEWVPDTVFSLFQQGVLRAFSIGFTIVEARAAIQKDIDRFGDNVRRIISKWKMHEFSVVAIPCNSNALATAVSKSSWLSQAWNLHEPQRLVASVPEVRRLRAVEPRRIRVA